MKNLLLEVLEKPFLTRPEVDYGLSSSPRFDQVQQNLDDVVPTGFFDNMDQGYFGGPGGQKYKTVKEQNDLIETYRRIAKIPEVSNVIDEVVDEAIFSPGATEIIELEFTDDVPQSIKDKLIEELKDISNYMNLNKNIYSMFKSFYIDGQLNVHIAYEIDSMSDGIKKMRVITPFGLQFNFSEDKWEYVIDGDVGNLHLQMPTGFNGDLVFDREEIIRIDSGIYSDNLILSNLHYSIKPANMLQTLEDMLIPMRFMRSVSRRVFNVDVSNLNNAKAKEVMEKHQTNFRYKKFYDLESGTISNQQHVAALTEDYWFPNRGGEKGTTVDLLDETGNLGELSDILYMKRKLYTSLKVPVNRINDEGEPQGEFGYDNDTINREELKFFNYISRLRNQFLELFYELLKREVITKEIATSEEWEDLLTKFKIKFTSENAFFQKMERYKISENLALFGDIQDYAGKYFSYEFIFKKVLGYSDEGISKLVEQLAEEPKDPLYSRFYGKDDSEEDSW